MYNQFINYMYDNKWKTQVSYFNSSQAIRFYDVSSIRINHGGTEMYMGKKKEIDISVYSCAFDVVLWFTALYGTLEARLL